MNMAGRECVRMARLTMVTGMTTVKANTMGLMARVQRATNRVHCAVAVCIARALGTMGTMRREVEGQGTTEYAILVGVLVVIAIAAILLFRGRIQELWDSIQSSINNL